MMWKTLFVTALALNVIVVVTTAAEEEEGNPWQGDFGGISGYGRIRSGYQPWNPWNNPWRGVGGGHGAWRGVGRGHGAWRGGHGAWRGVGDGHGAWRGGHGSWRGVGGGHGALRGVGDGHGAWRGVGGGHGGGSKRYGGALSKKYVSDKKGGYANAAGGKTGAFKSAKKYYKAKGAKKALAIRKKAAAGVNDINYKKKYYNEASKRYLKNLGRKRGINIYKKTGYNHENKFVHTSSHNKNAGLKALSKHTAYKKKLLDHKALAAKKYKEVAAAAKKAAGSGYYKKGAGYRSARVKAAKAGKLYGYSKHRAIKPAPAYHRKVGYGHGNPWKWKIGYGH